MKEDGSPANSITGRNLWHVVLGMRDDYHRAYDQLDSSFLKTKRPNNILDRTGYFSAPFIVVIFVIFV